MIKNGGYYSHNYEKQLKPDNYALMIFRTHVKKLGYYYRTLNMLINIQA